MVCLRLQCALCTVGALRACALCARTLSKGRPLGPSARGRTRQDQHPADWPELPFGRRCLSAGRFFCPAPTPSGGPVHTDPHGRSIRDLAPQLRAPGRPEREREAPPWRRATTQGTARASQLMRVAGELGARRGRGGEMMAPGGKRERLI